jgi:hypothetical protein
MSEAMGSSAVQAVMSEFMQFVMCEWIIPTFPVGMC